MGTDYDELTELVATRCNQALEECEEYLEKEYGGKVSEQELRIMAEEIIYKKAVKDTFQLLKYLNMI